MRYPVRVILAGGMTPEEILADYPDLQPEDIQAVLPYAAKLSEVGTVLGVARPVFWWTHLQKSSQKANRLQRLDECERAV